MATELCGFITIVIGTFLLHTTRDLDITIQNISQLTVPAPASQSQVHPLSRLPNAAPETQMRRSSLTPAVRAAESGWI
jgi:hypothetical protein